MQQKIIAVVLALLLVMQPVSAFSFFSDGTQKILRETWDAQTLAGLKNGTVSIPETAINDYLASVLPDYPDIREAHVTIHSNNQLILDLDTPKSGRLNIQGTITYFAQNSGESTVTIAIGKRKLLDKPVTSWFFAHISVGMLTKIFGNPLNGHHENFSTQINGNTLNINFKPYVDQSSLRSVSVYGMSLADLFNVDSLSTEEGLIHLHTSYHGPTLALPALQKAAEAL